LDFMFFAFWEGSARPKTEGSRHVTRI